MEQIRYMIFKEYIEKNNIKTDITYLNCSDNELTDLKEIENLIGLEYLSCYNNKITSLKHIDKLKKLKTIYSDITYNIEEVRRLILSEIRRDKISDI